MISVIIPTLNEAANIGRLLADLTAYAMFTEIIVVDGGSTDDTLDKVRQFTNIKFLQSAQGRAVQMNTGAAKASGDYLLFMHADTLLPKDLRYLERELTTTEAASFYMQFDKPSWLYRFYGRFTQLNWTIFTYGDQGLLIRKSVFENVGGFTNMPILEDVDLVRRVKKSHKFKKLPIVLTTSARRFEKNGVVKQQLLNIMLIVGYYLGCSPSFLKKFYRY